MLQRASNSWHLYRPRCGSAKDITFGAGSSSGKDACAAAHPSCTTSFAPLSAWHTLMAKWPRLSARWWFGLASVPCWPETTRWHSGRADLMVIWRTRRASGHRLLVIGAVRAERMKCEWLRLKCTTSFNQRVPELFSVSKTPFTINTVIRRTGQWIFFFSSFFFASPWTQRCFQLETSPGHYTASEASTSCMKDCCDISYGYYYMLPSLCCYIRQALTHGNQPRTVFVCC